MGRTIPTRGHVSGLKGNGEVPSTLSAQGSAGSSVQPNDHFDPEFSPKRLVDQTGSIVQFLGLKIKQEWLVKGGNEAYTQ